MKSDYRQVILALIIAVLIAFFVNATINAFSEGPAYNDYCTNEVQAPNRMELNSSEYDRAQEEYMQAQEECREEYDEARENHSLIVFIVSSISALILIPIGILLPAKRKADTTVSTGILIGGLLTLFIGTTRGWEGIMPEIRPLILLLEIGLVIYLTYRYLK